MVGVGGPEATLKVAFYGL